uniref:Uncharacterized protein n=1 Tax=Knipowitschia caucasica TaxID=637954 RepID=A0AAV2JDK8_KNICA
MLVMLWPLGQRCGMELVLLAVLSWASAWAEEKIIFDRHAVYWNSSNPNGGGGSPFVSDNEGILPPPRASSTDAFCSLTNTLSQS